MSRTIQAGEFRSSGLSIGRCFVYVLPCAYEDILKLGFSRDPIGRLQTLHQRYYEFFDLERAFLIETETVRDARKLELALGRDIAVHGAPAPLMIRLEAAGHTEWYRGAFAALAMRANDLRVRGFAVHEPASSWLRHDLLARSDKLFSWSSQMLQAINDALLTGLPAVAVQRALQDGLDAYAAFQIDLAQLVPGAVLEWYLAQRNGP